MLQNEQRIVEQLVDGPLGDDPDDSAHVEYSMSYRNDFNRN
jgi:hypothetical protein